MHGDTCRNRHPTETRGFNCTVTSGMLTIMGIPKEVIQQAARQGGYVTRAQLLRAGVSASAVDRRISDGELTVVSQGTYQVFASNDHIDLIRGALLALPKAVASHQSAAHLLDFPRLPKLEPTVLVASHTTHTFPGVMVRRCDDLDPSHLTTVERVPVTNVVRTVFDLAGVIQFSEFDAIAEALILAGRMELRHLERITDQLARRGKPGSRSARDFIEIRSGTDSKSTTLERRGRAALVAAGLAPPIAQFSIPWDPGRRFDAAYPNAMLAVEWDSRAWHQQRAAMTADRERDREAALHGWFVARFTWQDVTENPANVGATVAALLNDRRAAS